MPPHETYVEVFGGAGSVLFAKPPSNLEVFNDLDSGVWTFFRVLRTPKHAKRLQELLDNTPYSRQEFEECYHSWRNTDDEVELARRWFVAVTQAFGKNIGNSSWGYERAVGGTVRAYRSAIAALTSYRDRLKYVQLDHLDFRECITRYDAPGALIYCDPPYLPDVRVGGGYKYLHEMSAEDHVALLELLTRCKGMVMLSGYPSDLYSAMLTGWECINKGVVASSSNHAKRPKRTECIWLNPACQRAQVSLWPVEMGAGA